VCFLFLFINSQDRVVLTFSIRFPQPIFLFFFPFLLSHSFSFSKVGFNILWCVCFPHFPLSFIHNIRPGRSLVRAKEDSLFLGEMSFFNGRMEGEKMARKTQNKFYYICLFNLALRPFYPSKTFSFLKDLPLGMHNALFCPDEYSIKMPSVSLPFYYNSCLIS
jgi:hypothetical protein